ncbi:uncharacterized protein LOC134839037 isoform X2 [Symsagittifera roscoffensis]|uniref:uncharacterized protein LOC134839037 isoform X2 n=1 Tax=Symsagittifera roscoffensis TaxID=84072 RepID=UPI00307B2B4A
MKIKEKLKPRSLSTSGRAGSKKSSEFSELHFGRKTDSDFEDDGGFSQFQELQQSFFNRRGRQGSDSGSHTAHRSGDPHEHTMEYNTAGGPVTTITRRVRSVVDKPGSAAGKHGKDHSNCEKCNKAQPDLFQTLALTHNKRSPSGDVWDGAGGPAGGGPLGGGNRPRYASESNLLRAPMKPMAPYGYSPSVQNVYLPNGATPHTMRRPFGGLGGPGGAGTVVPSNTCYVQWGTEVKKLSLPLAHPPYYDENSGLAGGDQDRSVALNNMRELHGLLVSLFPIAVTEEDLSSKKKVVYIKDENTGIFYELEDITDVKPRCFLSIRDYASAASGTLPHSKSGHGIYDKADGTPGSGTGPGMGRLGSGTGARPPLKLSVFQPVAPSGRTNSDGRGSAPLVHPKATGGGSQPAGLDQLDRERSSSFASRDQTGRGLGRGGGAQTLGRNFTAGSSIKAQNTSRTMATPPGPRISQNEDTISPETEGDVYLAKTPPGFLGIDQDDGSGDRDGTESGLGAKSSAVDRLNASRHTNESSNTRERIEKSSTILIRDQVGDSSAQNSKLDHIEGQLGDLTQLVGTLLASQKEKSKSSGGSKDNKEQEARIAAELETLEKLKYLFEQQLQNKSNSSQSSNATTSSTMMNIRHHNQYISTVNEKNRITFDQLCALRERTRHLRLELNQLKRAHANHVTASQLMIREASQKICAAIEAFAQHARKDEEARGKRTSALAQAWALHLATLDKLESEISEMELMLEKMRSDADHYSKFPPSNNQQRQELKTIWDRRVEQLTHSVQDTGILISKVKVDLLEFETQMGDLVRLGGGVGEGQRRLLKDGPERLALFIERIRLLNSRLSQLKTLEMEVLNFQLHVEDVSSLSRPQSTPPEVPLHLNIGSSESERLNIIGMGGADSRSSSLKRVGRGGRQPVKVSTSTAANRYNLDSTSTTNLDGSSLSLNNKSLSRSYGSLNNSNMYATNNTNNNVNNTSYSLFEQHSYSTNKDGKGSTVTSTRTAGSGGAQAEKDRTDLMMLMTDLDAFSPQMASLSQLTNQQSSKRKTSASQMKRKRAESTRDRRNDEFSGSILDTAYASDRDSKEVIRKNSSSMMNTSSSSKSTTRVVNRETVIDDYYSALHQLQRTNREHLSSSRGNLRRAN